MAQIETWLNQEMTEAVKVQYLDGNLFSQDNAGNLIGVLLTKNGVPYSGGGTVAANVIRADGYTVAVSGALSGNAATVVLPQAAYMVPGVVSVVIKLTVNGEITTIGAVVANVYQSSTDTIVDPGTIIPSIETLVEAIDAAIESFNTGVAAAIEDIDDAVASIPADYSSLWTSLAPAFNSSNSYVIGQYVTYNGNVYRFIAPHSAGAWNSADVLTVNVSGELTREKDAISNKVNNNLAFGVGYLNGKYPNPSGANLLSDADYKTTDYIPVKPNTAYYKNIGFPFFHFFSEPNEAHWLSGQAISTKYFTTPANAYYIRVGGDAAKQFELYQAAGLVDLLDGVTLYEDTLVYYGAVRSEEGYISTDYIPVTSPLKIIVDVGANNGSYFFNGYNYNKQFNGGDVATIPQYVNNDNGNIAYIRLSYGSQYRDRIKIYGVFVEDEPYGKYADRFLANYAKDIIEIKNASSTSKIIHIGANQEYTTLRAGIAAAYNIGDATVYVHSGTYNLVQEFATEIAAHTESHCGIRLGNNIHVIFYQGAKVTAIFEQSSYSSAVWTWINDHFEPFWSAYADGCNFTIENLVCEMKNCRYCVHDELAGIDAAYIHKYINCTMKYSTTRTTDLKYLQCIGGGLGKNGTILVEGGLYESVDENDPNKNMNTISYHNGDNASAYSHIELRNVYAKGRSYFEFACYGSSTAKSPVLISSCSTGLHAIKVPGTVDNYNLYEFCCDIRIPGHWDYQNNTWVYIED